MQVRQAVPKDVESIMKIVREAQEYFASMGIPQWQNNYPSEEIILDDIKNDYGFVLYDSGVLGYVAISLDGESTYDRIYSGSWLSQSDFAVIHRLAIAKDKKGGGLASLFIGFAEALCKKRRVVSLRADTHEKNKSLQRVMEKHGFSRCGVIHLTDGSPRIAFEKLVV